MKIFLTAINAKYIHSNLAVYSLRAYAKDYQDQIVIGEYTINNRVDYILEQIYKAKPDVLCFSCYIWNMDYVEELITEYHKLCPEVPIWVGGPEVSYEVETFLAEHPQVTGVMIGEGERTFKQLCRYYVNRAGSLEEIRGIAFRDQDSGKTIFTPVQEPMNMSDIPFFRFDLLLERYRTLKSVTPMWTVRLSVCILSVKMSTDSLSTISQA